jgi:ankyrin repeat protein
MNIDDYIPYNAFMDEITCKYNKLMIAVRSGKIKQVKELVKKGATINIESSDFNTTVLKIAAVNGRLKIIKYLINNGADVNYYTSYKQSPLNSAIWTEDNFEIIEYLVKSGADVNHISEAGESALTLACGIKRNNTINLRYIEYLLQNGAVPHKLNKENLIRRHRKTGKITVEYNGHLNPDVVSLFKKYKVPNFEII